MATAATTTGGVKNGSVPDAARTVFVTGGSGYLGRRLIPALLSGGYQVRALTNPTRAMWCRSTSTSREARHISARCSTPPNSVGGERAGHR